MGYQSETFLSCCPSYLAVTSDSKHEIRNIVSYPFMGGFLCCFGFSSGLYLFEAPLVYTETLKMKKRNVDPKSYGPFSFFFGKVHLLQSCQKKTKRSYYRFNSRVISFYLPPMEMYLLNLDFQMCFRVKYHENVCTEYLARFLPFLFFQSSQFERQLRSHRLSILLK